MFLQFYVKGNYIYRQFSFTVIATRWWRNYAFVLFMYLCLSPSHMHCIWFTLEWYLKNWVDAVNATAIKFYMFLSPSFPLSFHFLVLSLFLTPFHSFFCFLTFFYSSQPHFTFPVNKCIFLLLFPFSFFAVLFFLRSLFTYFPH